MTEPSKQARDLAWQLGIDQMKGQSGADSAARLIDAALAVAWDAGHRASERDFEFIWDLSTPDEDREPYKNPYRQGDASFAVGDQVRYVPDGFEPVHPESVGTVEAVNGERARVRFPEGTVFVRLDSLAAPLDGADQ